MDFRKQIEPLFKERRHACHAGTKQLGGLRLDTRESALAGGYSGAVIKPGNAAASKLIALIDGTSKQKAMPMGGPRLTAEQVGWACAWIDQGAHWPADSSAVSSAKPKTTHWAFAPLQVPRRRAAALPAGCGIRSIPSCSPSSRPKASSLRRRRTARP